MAEKRGVIIPAKRSAVLILGLGMVDPNGEPEQIQYFFSRHLSKEVSELLFGIKRFHCLGSVSDGKIEETDTQAKRIYDLDNITASATGLSHPDVFFTSYNQVYAQELEKARLAYDFLRGIGGGVEGDPHADILTKLWADKDRFRLEI